MLKIKKIKQIMFNPVSLINIYFSDSRRKILTMNSFKI